MFLLSYAFSSLQGIEINDFFLNKAFLNGNISFKATRLDISHTPIQSIDRLLFLKLKKHSHSRKSETQNLIY